MQWFQPGEDKNPDLSELCASKIGEDFYLNFMLPEEKQIQNEDITPEVIEQYQNLLQKSSIFMFGSLVIKEELGMLTFICNRLIHLIKKMNMGLV